jgi:uncharacterized protein YhfF
MDDAAADLPRWGFAFPGPLRDELTALALAGIKTTTAGLLVEVELDEEMPVVGARSVLVDSAERPVAILETVACRVARLADVDDRHAIDEGEGYANAAEFRVAHERFWNSYLDELRARLADPELRAHGRHARGAGAVPRSNPALTGGQEPSVPRPGRAADRPAGMRRRAVMELSGPSASGTVRRAVHPEPMSAALLLRQPGSPSR